MREYLKWFAVILPIIISGTVDSFWFGVICGGISMLFYKYL